jgi:hypothetical protein
VLKPIQKSDNNKTAFIKIVCSYLGEAITPDVTTLGNTSSFSILLEECHLRVVIREDDCFFNWSILLVSKIKENVIFPKRLLQLLGDLDLGNNITQKSYERHGDNEGVFYLGVLSGVSSMI